MTLIRIRGIVFNWSLRVCVTYLSQRVVQDNKNQHEKTPHKIDKIRQRSHAKFNLAKTETRNRMDLPGRCETIPCAQYPPLQQSSPNVRRHSEILLDRDRISGRAARLPYGGIQGQLLLAALESGMRCRAPQDPRVRCPFRSGDSVYFLLSGNLQFQSLFLALQKSI